MGDDDNYYNDEELVVSNTSDRNWKGIIIAILVIMFVCGMIVTSVVLLTPPDEGPRVKGERISLEHILGTEYSPLRFNGTWVSEHEFVYRDANGGVSVFNSQMRLAKTLMNDFSFGQFKAVHFWVSPDLKYVLLAHDVQKLYRHTFLAQYTVFEVETTSSFSLTPKEEEVSSPMLLYAGWSSKENAIVMVYNYDIFYKPFARGNVVHRITDTALPGVVSHGVPDWLYEEEILNSNHALWFSDDGKMLVYATFNDSLVEEHKFVVYGSLIHSTLYPDVQRLRYPKPGTNNPSVTLWVVDLSDLKALKPRDLKPPIAVRDQDHYFTAVRWVDNNQVAVVWMNRAQNLSLITTCNGTIWMCQETHRVISETKGWVDIYEPPVFSRDGFSYLLRLPVLDGDRGSFTHVVLINTLQKRSHALTHGNSEVRRILGWDQGRNIVYYLGTLPGKPSQQHIFRVMAERPYTARSPECITCELKSADSSHEKCSFHQAAFSPSFRYFALECLGPGVPFVTLHSAKDNRMIAFLQNNTDIRDKSRELAFPQIRRFEAEIGDGLVAQVRLLLPPGLREEEITTYPLVVQVYGGPGSQLVVDRWQLDFGSYLASKKGFIIAQVDGRGSGGQGLKLQNEVHFRLGRAEVEDQVAVARYLVETFHYIDERRVGVYGWSYGGFVSSMIMADAQEVFKCGVAIAPVTNWRLYDSVYTERYMGSPNVTGNYKGYEESDVTKQILEYFSSKQFLLVHGTADDNVHFQQSMMLSKALSEAGIMFRQQIYPDETHDLNGVKDHMYRTIESFLSDCFRKNLPHVQKKGNREGGLGDEEE